VNKFKILGLILLLTACESKTRTIEGKFIESGYNDHRSYDFKRDGTFTFRNRLGHDTAATGTYIISNDIMFLDPDTDFHDRDIRVKLKVLSNDCLRDYDNIYYCSDSLQCEKVVSEDYAFQEEVVSILDTLPEITRQKERLDSIDGKFGGKVWIASDLSVEHQGIIVVNRQEFHLFEYETARTAGYNIYFLVRKSPFEIYRLNGSIIKSYSPYFDFASMELIHK